MTSNLVEKIKSIERELVALKSEKVKIASNLRTKEVEATLNFTCELRDYNVNATQAAIITVTATNTELASISFRGNWDGRFYETRRQVGTATTIKWVVAPTIFLISDFDRTAGFTLSVPITITASSDAEISISYGTNPYREDF